MKLENLLWENLNCPEKILQMKVFKGLNDKKKKKTASSEFLILTYGQADKDRQIPGGNSPTLRLQHRDGKGKKERIWQKERRGKCQK